VAHKLPRKEKEMDKKEDKKIEESQPTEDKETYECVVVLLRKKDGKGFNIFPHIETNDFTIERGATNSDVLALCGEAIELVRSQMAASHVIMALGSISRGPLTTKSGIEIPRGSRIPSDMERK
jgi:hypothetical protein